MGVGDHGVVGHDHDVAGLQELEAAGHGVALHGGDDGHVDLGDRGQGPPEGLEQLGQGGRPFPPEAVDLGDVAPGGEVAAGAADHDDGGLAGQPAQPGLQLPGQLHRDGVHRLRPVQRQPADRPVHCREHRSVSHSASV